MHKTVLYLIPSDLGEPVADRLFPPDNLTILEGIDAFIVENLRSARRFLRAIGYRGDFDQKAFFELNQKSTEEDRSAIVHSLMEHKRIGLLSEAGVPGVADPGADIIFHAHKLGIKVVPLVGPSSILLALMASGTNGQRFCFHGYLPIKRPERIRALKDLEKRSRTRDETQIFMETPYRNQSILEDILQHCPAETLLCVAADLSLKTESIRTLTIREWRNKLPDLKNRPAIFLIYSGNTHA